jgi:hypothetical protein
MGGSPFGRTRAVAACGRGGYDQGLLSREGSEMREEPTDEEKRKDIARTQFFELIAAVLFMIGYVVYRGVYGY